MPCDGCTEFLTQGSGTVGAGSAFSFEKVVIAEDPDNIPLLLLSVKALSKDGVDLVDQTPAWLEATTSGQSVLVGGKLIYRLTVTVEIDGLRILIPESGDPDEWGPGTYTIELRAQVEDASKPVITCLFDVCISQSGFVIGDLFMGSVGAGDRLLFNLDIPLLGATLPVPIVTAGQWTAAACGFGTFDFPNPHHFHPDLRLVLWVDEVVYRVGVDNFTPCPVAMITATLGLPYAVFDWNRNRVYYMDSTLNQIRHQTREGTDDTLLVDLGFAMGSMMEYSSDEDALYVRNQGPNLYKIDIPGQSFVLINTGVTANPTATVLTLDEENQHILEPIGGGVRRWPLDGSASSEVIWGGSIGSGDQVRWNPDDNRYYFFDGGNDIERVDIDGNNLEVVGTSALINDRFILVGFNVGS